MYTKQPKKMIIINILDILKRYTDENHCLSQREIMDILEREYDMKVDRKAVKRNLMNLIDFGYQVEYSESIRQGKNGEEEVIFTDWYLEKDFTDSELRLLIDSILFSKHIPYSQCKALIEKLEGLSNCYFKSRVKHIQTMPDTEPQNKQLFYTIEMLDKAITKGRQVAFYYNEYHTDMKLYPRENDEGKKRRYVINPYQIAAINGRYYLICNYDKYDNVANYRLDRIADIEVLPTPVKPMKKVKGLENGLNLPKHMAEHVYMFTGESAAVTFRAKKYLVSEIIDWFGKDIKFSDETEDEVTVRVTVNLEAMRKWALQYAVHVKVLGPEKLVELIRDDVKEAAEQYGRGADDMSKGRFEELEKKAQQAGSLKELFEYWKEAQIEESKESCETTFPRGKEFEELYGAEFKKSFKCDGKLNCDVEKTESLNVPILFVCKESNASDEIERMLSSYALHQKAYKELNAREKMESKEWGTNFWMQDVIRWKLYHEAPQGRAGSKYYNCLRTLVKNAQNAIGSCELIDCAYMNINKRGGYNTADKTRIRNYAEKYKKFIKREIELLDPEIIICCGILDDQGECKDILKSCGKSVYLYKRHPSRYSKDLCNWEKLEEL